MINFIKKHKITFGVFGAILTAAVAALFQEIGVALSGVMVQFGLCRSGDYLCILKTYGIFSLLILFIAFLLDTLGDKSKTDEKKDCVSSFL